MLGVLRRMGIALGSFVAAALCMYLVGGIVLALLGLTDSAVASTALTVGTFVLGWLIYRDILRREVRPPRT